MKKNVLIAYANGIRNLMEKKEAAHGGTGKDPAERV